MRNFSEMFFGLCSSHISYVKQMLYNAYNQNYCTESDGQKNQAMGDQENHRVHWRGRANTD